MPRKARLFVPGCIYHVMSRGIEGRDIFVDSEDRSRFCLLLTEYLKRSGYQCLAWALMSNHYHLVLRASDRPLSEVMKPLNSRYARWFGLKYRRRGYLFQDRYRSIVTQDQNYAQQLLRYVHLNPLRAGVCRTLESLDRYPWCGHSVLMGYTRCAFQDASQVLRRFGGTERRARGEYREYLAQGVSEFGSDIPELVRKSNIGHRDRHKTECWVIGDRTFVLEALAADRRRRAQIAQHAVRGLTIENLVAFVSKKTGIDIPALQYRSRMPAVSGARKALAYLGCRTLEMPSREIARFLHVSSSAVSQMLESGREVAEQLGIERID